MKVWCNSREQGLEYELAALRDALKASEKRAKRYEAEIKRLCLEVAHYEGGCSIVDNPTCPKCHSERV